MPVRMHSPNPRPCPFLYFAPHITNSPPAVANAPSRPICVTAGAATSTQRPHHGHAHHVLVQLGVLPSAQSDLPESTDIVDSYKCHSFVRRVVRVYEYLRYHPSKDVDRPTLCPAPPYRPSFPDSERLPPPQLHTQEKDARDVLARDPYRY